MVNNPEALKKILIINFGESDGISKNGDVAFFCPFCNHHKKKLAVNINTGFWHCWVCQTGSKSIISLFKKTNRSGVIQDVVKILDRRSQSFVKYDDGKPDENQIYLPKEYKPLSKPSRSPEYKQAWHYLKSRNFTETLVDRYNIGYCTEGKYRNRLIIPSYSESGMVNYFVARTYYLDDDIKKYDNPVAPKNIVPFELYTSWAFPVILVEGVFDAMKIDRNAIPILGNSIGDAIIEKLLNEGVKQVYLALDADAMRFVYREIMKLIEAGIQVQIVELPPDKDPGEMDQHEFLRLIETSVASTDLKTKMKFKMMSR
jgi:DNA primase